MKKIYFPIAALLSILAISCEKEVSTSPEDVLLPENSLFIDSNPRGSKILIDGRYMGQRTPDTIKWMEAGNHLVTLKAKLLKDTNVVVNINKEYDAILLDYTKNPTMRGNIYCESNPSGAQIFVNDSNTSLTTPQLLRGLFPSEYKITLKIPGCWDMQLKTSAVSERTSTLSARMTDTTIWVNFTRSNIGLPTDSINDMDIQDGYIKWFATEGKGLIKYISDSLFTVYNTENSLLPSNNIKAVRVSSDGIWIATYKGIALFKNSNFTVYNSSNSIVSDSITCIYPGPGGKVLVGSKHRGVFYYNGSFWLNYNMDNSPLLTNIIQSVFISPDGILWVGTFGWGLLLYNGTSWMRTFANIPSPRVDAILPTESDLWVGTTTFTGHTFGSSGGGGGSGGGGLRPMVYLGGLGHFSNNHWDKYREAGLEIRALAIDDMGNLWFSDYPNGLRKWVGNSFLEYNQYSRINRIVSDASGNLWMSTERRGIVKYKGVHL